MVRSEIELEAYVLNVIPQKENDVIINLITEAGIKSIYGRGYAKPKSKNYILNNRLLKVKITGIDQKFFRLMDTKILALPNTKSLTMNKFMEISKLISFFINTKEYQDKISFLMFDHMIEQVDKIDITHFSDFFFVHTLNNLGVKFTLDYCVKCQSKNNLVGFNFYEGGCICHNCQTYENSLTLDEFRALYAVFNLKIDAYLKMKRYHFIHNELINLFEESFGISMRKWRESGRTNNG